MKFLHSNEEDVAAILNANLSIHDASKAFEKIITNGPLHKNIEKCDVEGAKDSETITNNPINGNAVTCDMCKSTYSKKNIRRHKKTCYMSTESGTGTLDGERRKNKRG